MSADNGIYIFTLKDGKSFVTEMSAVDRLYWSFETFDSCSEVNPIRFLCHFDKATPLTIQEARNLAFEKEENILSSDFPVLEYGISTIKVNKTMEELVQYAKENVDKEIAGILSSTHDADVEIGRWRYDLAELRALKEKLKDM